MGQVSGAGGTLEDKWARWIQQTSGGRMPHPEPRHAASDRPSARSTAREAGGLPQRAGRARERAAARKDTLTHSTRPGARSRARGGKTRLERGSGARTVAVDDLQQVLRGFRRSGHVGTKVAGGWDGGLLGLAAAGQLDPKAVRAELRRAGVSEPRFRAAMFNALRSQIAQRVGDALKTAEAQVAQLQRDPSALIARLGQMVDRPQREQTLRRLGLDADAARSIAENPAASCETLRKGLDTVRHQLSAARQEATLGSLFDRHSPAMFRLFAPTADALSGRKGSYLAQVKQDGLRRCNKAQQIDSVLKTALGVAAAIAGGVLTTGVLLGAATGAGAAALTGLPDQLAAGQDLAAARGAETVGAARQGAVRDAEANHRRATVNHVKGTVLGGLGGGLNGYVGASAGGRISEIRAPAAAVIPPVVADGVNRVTDR